MAKNKSKDYSQKAVSSEEIGKGLFAIPSNESLTDPDQISFAEERLRLHESAPETGLSIEVFKAYFTRKYGF